MRHIVITLLTLTFALSFPCSSVFAQNGTSSGTTRREAAKQRVQNLRVMIEEKREERASKAAEHRELMLDRLSDHRARLASKAATLRGRLAQFKDQRKAKIVERINTVLNRINEKITSAMDKHVDKMSELLDKLEDRVAKKGQEGKDTTAADTAIASASAKIASASAAIDAQKLKDYTITISSESAARADAKAARDKLHSDLAALRRIIIDAKQSVAAAIRTAATTLEGIGNGN